MKLSSPFVITISRQLGSGGEYIGQQLAKTLNFFYADREIINEAAKQLSLLEKDIESRDEKVSTFWQSYFNSFAYTTPDTYIPPQVVIPTDSVVFRVESEVIEHIANERSAVIIGRCGSHILREHPNHLSLFFHAGRAFRISRIQTLKKMSEGEAEKMIIQSDKERAHYYHTFTGRVWADATEYDLALDTGKTGLDKSVEIILKYLDMFKAG